MTFVDSNRPLFIYEPLFKRRTQREAPSESTSGWTFSWRIKTQALIAGIIGVIGAISTIFLSWRVARRASKKLELGLFKMRKTENEQEKDDSSE